MQKIIVLGASPNPERYSYKAVRSLLKRGYDAVPIGIREGFAENLPILLGKPVVEDVHTVLLYIGPERQREYLDYIIRLKPQRIVFNPGTENPELINLCRKNGIEVVIDCALTMLSTGNF